MRHAALAALIVMLVALGACTPEIQRGARAVGRPVGRATSLPHKVMEGIAEGQGDETPANPFGR